MKAVFILADALRVDHLSCYGGLVETPNIDKIAEKGILYTKFFANSNATEPCITTILTGHYPHNHGILRQPRITTFEEISKQKIRTDIEEHHLCRLLGTAGYRTALVDAFSIFNRVYFDEHHQVSFDFRSARTAEETALKAKIMLSRKMEENVFVFIHFWNTHHPYFPDYRGEVRKLDETIGTLLPLVDFKEDVVFFTADHGESIGEHVTAARKNDPGHHHLYEEIIHLPFIVCAPSLERQVADIFMEQIDVVPLILNLLGINYQEQWFDTRALMPDKSIIFVEEHTYQEQIGSRTDTFKFIEKLGDKLRCPLCGVIHGNARYELYQLERDLEEKMNLAPFQEIAEIAKLSAQVRNWYGKI